MDPYRKMGIYVGYYSLSIIKYLEHMTEDLFTARHVDCIFNEDYFPALGEEFHHNLECQEINWNDKLIISSDPHTQETELQVQKIINLQNATNNLPYAFIYYNAIIKSWNHVVNVSERVKVPKKTTQAPSKKEEGESRNH
jgi:hypothetical protein